jgi:hypothetical protein
MILPHYYAIYQAGDIVLSEEYSEYNWVPITELKEFEPKIMSIPASVKDMQLLMNNQLEEDLITI